MAGRAAGVAGTAAGFPSDVLRRRFPATFGSATQAALAAGDFVPMPRVEAVMEGPKEARRLRSVLQESGGIDAREPLPRSGALSSHISPQCRLCW